MRVQIKDNEVQLLNEDGEDVTTWNVNPNTVLSRESSLSTMQPKHQRHYISITLVNQMLDACRTYTTAEDTKLLNKIKALIKNG